MIFARDGYADDDAGFRYTDLQPVGMGAFGLVWYVFSSSLLRCADARRVDVWRMAQRGEGDDEAGKRLQKLTDGGVMMMFLVLPKIN
jgi:hypothetical protein